MAENVQQPIEVPVPLQLFGGLVTEMFPSDLPEGISPDCQDLVFFPGGIASRPCLERVLAANVFPANTTVTYQKSFVLPNGVTKNLYLTSDGSFFVALINPDNSVTVTKLTTVAPGSYASSITSFGKELITFHNNSYGTDVARIYDGTYLDRVTQCGPAAPPSVANVALPAVVMAPTGAPTSTAITSLTPSDPIVVGPPGHQFTVFTTLTLVVASTIGFSVGEPCSVSGATGLNGSYSINSILSGISLKVGYGSTNSFPQTGGTLAGTPSNTLIRQNSEVTCNTAAAHNLQVGFQVQISGTTATSIGGTIVSITIKNEDMPGIATIVMSAPHGLQPETQISITGVGPASTSTVSAVNDGTVTTLTYTGTAPDPGTTVQISAFGGADAVFNGTFIVESKIGTNTVSYSQILNSSNATTAGATTTTVPAVISSAASGSSSTVWPVSNNSLLPSYFTVETVPSDTTFQVALSYPDGTWAGGTVSFLWDGIFYVTEVVTPTEFVYKQIGPDATTTSVGNVTPYGQASPGKHGVAVIFQTRQGFQTAPSPLGSFIANGGQYVSVTNIPRGPSNVVARIIIFTGADGGNFFYIPTPRQLNGIVVSTGTVIQDNVTTSVILDFGDNTLFDSIAVDINGNNLFEMAVMGPALQVDSYASRAGWHGMRNSIQNFLNLGFEGGFFDSSSPLGWTVNTTGGSVDSVHVDYGDGWLISGNNGTSGQIQQSAYQDSYSVDILQQNTAYSFQVKLKTIGLAGGSGGSINIDFFDTSGMGILLSGSIPVSSIGTVGEFFQVDMINPATGDIYLPSPIPQDTVMRVYGLGVAVGTSVLVDDLEFYPTANPFATNYWWSYVNLPEELDLETGKLGAASDPTYIQCSFIHKDSFMFLTNYGLYETRDLASEEPQNWPVSEVSVNCGACGPRCCTTGENFSAWVSAPSSQPPVGRGLYLYTGGSVYKVSQEIQPDFDLVNISAQQSIWAVNDPVNRRIYLGLPQETSVSPNVIYVLDYREMDTASEIASKPPIHISFSGKMICSDLSRKWNRWSLAAQCAEIMTVPGIGPQFSIGCGNGEAPGLGTGFANSYWFNPSKYTDDDYGQVVPYYMTYFFVNHEMEQAIQVGAHRKLFKRYAVYITGIGQMILTPFVNSVSNPYIPSPGLTLTTNIGYDLGDGLNVIGERCAFRVDISPIVGTDVYFKLTRLIITLQQEPISPIRFGAI